MSAVWDVPHLEAGSAEPQTDPNVITVYNMRFCPFAERTVLVLLEKKIPFKVVNVSLVKKPEWFLENTWGTVSVVKYKEKYIMESLINSDFVDELYPETSLHPKDPLLKAEGRLLVEQYGKMRGPYYGILRAKKDTPEETKAEQKRLFTELLVTLKAMESQLAKLGTKYFCGSKVGMTDLMVWPWMERFGALDVMFPGLGLSIPADLTHLEAWMTSMRQVESVKKYGLSTSDHVRFYASAGTGNPAYDMLLDKPV